MMNLDPDLINAMFARYDVSGPWEALPATGLANRIFATRNVVLRVATDHADGVKDARTESVAAPVARAAGILRPRLIAFDDTRTLVERPFSLWERVHGETLGLTSLSARQTADVWFSVGRELAWLHMRVRECADPEGYLDELGPDPDVDAILSRLVHAKRLDMDAARRVKRFTEELRPHIADGIEPRFIHHDIHAMNIMCSSNGELLAIIDWGDAGWGDPALDFAAIPLDAIQSALQGYEAEAPGLLGAHPQLRIAWNNLLDTVDGLWDNPRPPPDLDAFRRFVRLGVS